MIKTITIVDDDVKFVHIREYDAVGEEKPCGGLTVAFVRDRREGEQDVYLCSMSQCSKLDNFNKKIGRSITKGRLHCGMYDELKTSKTKVKEVAEDVIKWAISS